VFCIAASEERENVVFSFLTMINVATLKRDGQRPKSNIARTGLGFGWGSTVKRFVA
jgi:hypothetical protein